MGNSPDDGWIQRVTIEIPGPVSDQETWEAYKQAVQDVLDQFADTIGAQIVEITNMRKPPAGGGSDTEPEVT
ncbi:MAG TPA: hypothetical protein VFC42_03335 [Methylomirabilota bacterium]|jgi:hypothetical protein|nr:hypothetical protein [Methylomirabilota bacterium]